MILKKSHIASLNYAIQILTKTVPLSKPGKALDKLKSHISRLEHLRLVVHAVESQGYFDFSNFETITRKNRTGKFNQSHESREAVP